ncbi:hypothetical protein B0T10DRAFT_534062 [Thelonectria olida]|uniref:CoA-binding domain-containing protein n=1 Tax=Thelonectria olida TaxID=1576542 RepID=A0A9P8VPS7_9HYPO|nr:hypothetical protein B0T10DRAFT_534062 [Thelonectria olida]
MYRRPLSSSGLQPYEKETFRAFTGSCARPAPYDAEIANLNIDKNTRVIYQGFTGKAATIGARDTIAYGTNIVGGVSPGKGGQEHLGLPVFITVKEAMEKFKRFATSVFVPAQFAARANIEAIESEVPFVVSVAEHILVHNMIRSKTQLVGLNCPSIIALEQCRISIMPHKHYIKGVIRIISKSGTLSYEAIGSTTKFGLGQGLNTPSLKPIAAMVAGQTAPQGRTMGHAGALLSPHDVSTETKAKALEDSGAIITPHPGVMGEVITSLLASNLSLV